MERQNGNSRRPQAMADSHLMATWLTSHGDFMRKTNICRQPTVTEHFTLFYTHLPLLIIIRMPPGKIVMILVFFVSYTLTSNTNSLLDSFDNLENLS
jgi:hypothetical protein